MEIVHTASLTFEPTALQHRGAGLAFKNLFLGPDDDIPNNYLFVHARQESYYSPVHRHNFDQFRFGLRGDVSILPDLTVHSGELCYHPEGVRYGPQDDGPAEREVLVLQFGGASGQGFLSHEAIGQAQQRLSKRGRFEKGRFYEEGRAGGDGVDSFQALWEDTMGKPLVYPSGRYDRPVKVIPSAFAWRDVPGISGVQKKTLGVFSERETRAELWKVSRGGVWEVPPEAATQLFFVLEGSGSADGHAWTEQDAGRLKAGVKARISTEGEITLLRFVLPLLEEARVNGSAAR